MKVKRTKERKMEQNRNEDSYVDKGYQHNLLYVFFAFMFWAVS